MRMTTRLGLTAVLAGLLALGAAAADELTPEERDRRTAKAAELNTEGVRLYQRGDYPRALAALQEALDLRRQLYPEAKYPQGHERLADSLNNLATLHQARGEYDRAEQFFRDAL